MSANESNRAHTTTPAPAPAVHYHVRLSVEYTELLRRIAEEDGESMAITLRRVLREEGKRLGIVETSRPTR